MYIIDESHFIKDISLPNTGGSLDVTGGYDTTKQWIDSETRLCLQNALGNVLFQELDAQVKNGTLLDTAPTKWKELIKGKTYTYNSVVYTWKGLKFTEGSDKYSLLAYFVYSQYVDAKRTQLSSMGESAGQSINALSIFSRRRYVTYYNKYVELYCGDTCNGYVSLLTYLTHQESDFPDASKVPSYYENQMGI